MLIRADHHAASYTSGQKACFAIFADMRARVELLKTTAAGGGAHLRAVLNLVEVVPCRLGPGPSPARRGRPSHARYPSSRGPCRPQTARMGRTRTATNRLTFSPCLGADSCTANTDVTRIFFFYSGVCCTKASAGVPVCWLGRSTCKQACLPYEPIRNKRCPAQPALRSLH